jgi:hypothetical protein
MLISRCQFPSSSGSYGAILKRGVSSLMHQTDEQKPAHRSHLFAMLECRPRAMLYNALLLALFRMLFSPSAQSMHIYMLGYSP